MTYVDLTAAANELRRDLSEYAKIDRLARNAGILANEHPADDDRPITPEWIPC